MYKAFILIISLFRAYPIGNQLDKPPSIFLEHKGNKYEMVRGTYSWTIKEGFGSSRGVEADSPAPDKLIEYQEYKIIAESKDEIKIIFDVKPKSYELFVWDSYDYKERVKTTVNNKFFVPEDKDKVIYELIAHWSQGTAHYAIEIDMN